MTRRKELPWEKIIESVPGECPEHERYATKGRICAVDHRDMVYFRKVPEAHAEMFAELVRRVLEKNDFTEFAKKCQKEIGL